VLREGPQVVATDYAHGLELGGLSTLPLHLWLYPKEGGDYYVPGTQTVPCTPAGAYLENRFLAGWNRHESSKGFVLIHTNICFMFRFIDVAGLLRKIDVN
jgi:hypothetical protein